VDICETVEFKCGWVASLPVTVIYTWLFTNPCVPQEEYEDSLVDSSIVIRKILAECILLY
jgi:hypothetical protein